MRSIAVTTLGDAEHRSPLRLANEPGRGLGRFIPEGWPWRAVLAATGQPHRFGD